MTQSILSLFLLVLILYCVISLSTIDGKNDFQKSEQEDEFYGKDHPLNIDDGSKSPIFPILSDKNNSVPYGKSESAFYIPRFLRSTHESQEDETPAPTKRKRKRKSSKRKRVSEETPTKETRKKVIDDSEEVPVETATKKPRRRRRIRVTESPLLPTEPTIKRKRRRIRVTEPPPPPPIETDPPEKEFNLDDSDLDDFLHESPVKYTSIIHSQYVTLRFAFPDAETQYAIYCELVDTGVDYPSNEYLKQMIIKNDYPSYSRSGTREITLMSEELARHDRAICLVMSVEDGITYEPITSSLPLDVVEESPSLTLSVPKYPVRKQVDLIVQSTVPSHVWCGAYIVNQPIPTIQELKRKQSVYVKDRKTISIYGLQSGKEYMAYCYGEGELETPMKDLMESIAVPFSTEHISLKFKYVRVYPNSVIFKLTELATCSITNSVVSRFEDVYTAPIQRNKQYLIRCNYNENGEHFSASYVFDTFLSIMDYLKIIVKLSLFVGFMLAGILMVVKYRKEIEYRIERIKESFAPSSHEEPSREEAGLLHTVVSERVEEVPHPSPNTKEWRCVSCQYYNKNSIERCEMCNVKNPDYEEEVDEVVVPVNAEKDIE